MELPIPKLRKGCYFPGFLVPRRMAEKALTAVNSDGRREVLGMEIGTSEADWTAFLRKLTRRGLRDVKLVVSDAHEGIKAAVSKVLCAILLEQNDERAVQRARYMTLETINQMSDDPLVRLPAVAS